MNIYLVSQKENNNYDTFDSFVTVAENEEQARDTDPEKVWDGGWLRPSKTINWEEANVLYSSWATKRETNRHRSTRHSVWRDLCLIQRGITQASPQSHYWLEPSAHLC